MPDRPAQEPARPRPAGVRVASSLYLPYALGIGLKRALGMSCERHRSFFMLRVVRAIEAGKITGRLDITAAGKRDGAGAQAIARISARCFAAAFGLRYVHTPFQTLAHAELPMDQWLAAWEELFGLGADAPLAADSPFPPVDLETYAMTPALWREDRLLTVRHYHPFRAMAPTLGLEEIEKLRARHAARHPPVPRSPDAPLEVRVHVRRGDVRPGDAQTGHRFTANHSILPTVEAAVRAVRALGREARVTLYSLGAPEDFSEFNSISGLQLQLNLPAIDTFLQLAEADVLLAARSDFSHVAAMYGRGVVVCDPRHRTPLPDWILLDPATGLFDAAALTARLRRACAG